MKTALLFTSLAIALTLGRQTTAAADSDFAERAAKMRQELVEKVMPYWHDTAQDKERGGYLLADNAGSGRGRATEKQLVTQSRMVWGFAHAHRQGWSDARRNYLAAAEQGYRFLMRHFRDAEHGGYFWSTDLDGKVLNDRKIVYGNSFVIYALVELHRASKQREPIERALELHRDLQKHAHDGKQSGWIEHFRRNWEPILTPEPQTHVEVAGYKSANTHLHLMEAFTELFEATKDAAVRQSLLESVRLNQEYFYPREAGRSCFHRQSDWKEVTAPSSAGLSYGHNVEFAWLLIGAEQVLGVKPSWDHFDAHLDHALKFGYDHERGGLYNRGEEDQPASQKDKVWWVQSEMLAALTDALLHRADPYREEALRKLLDFVWKYQVDPTDGIWLDTVTEEGKPKSPGKAHNWKANYHDVRAMVKFVEAFGKESK